jgi:hypothetical protein
MTKAKIILDNLTDDEAWALAQSSALQMARDIIKLWLA